MSPTCTQMIKVKVEREGYEFPWKKIE